MGDPKQLIREALPEVRELMERAFAEVGGIPAPDSDLDQAGLKDGAGSIEEYLDVGEYGMAFDHLLYMIDAGKLPISLTTFQFIEQAGRAMNIDPKQLEKINP